MSEIAVRMLLLAKLAVGMLYSGDASVILDAIFTMPLAR